jgi:hypothetical protein
MHIIGQASFVGRGIRFWAASSKLFEAIIIPLRGDPTVSKIESDAAMGDHFVARRELPDRHGESTPPKDLDHHVVGSFGETLHLIALPRQ